jgi:hypothetical protein
MIVLVVGSVVPLFKKWVVYPLLVFMVPLFLKWVVYPLLVFMIAWQYSPKLKGFDLERSVLFRGPSPLRQRPRQLLVSGIV